jgi:proteasome activator subunit 4
VLSECHAGVLALTALVQSQPYTVPLHVPGIIMHLSHYATTKVHHICATSVRTCMADFKRTHQDCWHEHKRAFTDDQLAVLTDLLVSPSYYV